MKRRVYLFLLLALLSVASGMLMSYASWLGRVGITFFHKEYNFLKIWWQGAVGVFLIFVVLFYMQHVISAKLPALQAKITHSFLFIMSAGCLYFTHYDFRHTLSHRILGWRFHYGFYLIWIGWAIICLFYIFGKTMPKTIITDQDKKETITQ